MVVDVDKKINVKDLVPNTRVALREDSGHVLHKIMPSKVDPLVALMKVEKVPDSTYDTSIDHSDTTLPGNHKEQVEK